MASLTIVDRITFGNMKCLFCTLTDISDSGSTFTIDGLQTVHAVKAVNNTDSSDTFKESIGAWSGSTRNQVTFTAVTANDDGHAWIWGR